MKQAIKSNVESAWAHWYVWLFPFFALVISIFLIYQHYHLKGEFIRIHFDEAAAIQPEKTQVRFRGVTVGMVKSVTIGEDNKDVIAHVLLQEGSENFAVEGSKFWIVSPKVSLEGLSGLDTLLGGAYIATVPGKSDAAPKEEFKAKMGSDASDPLENTTAFYLDSPSAESVAIGASVTYRGFAVGTVSKMNLSKTGQSIIIQINVHNKYDKLIRANSVFWRKVGIQADLGLFGSNIKVNSLDSILHGGVEFATPEPAGALAKALTTFPLAPAIPKGSEKWNPKLEYERPEK
jgi:paraquat-inducible protein B